MKKNLFLILIVLFFSACGIPESEYAALSSQNEALNQELTELKKRISELDYLKDHSQVVLPNTEFKEITAASNGQNYKIKVQLPRDYNQNTQTYPVLYVTDAETNFGGIGYIAQRLMKDKLIPPMIVVGVAYGTDYKTFYELRSRDLTPVEDKDLRMGGKIDPTGGAAKFCDFLSQELFPFIEKNYRIDRTNQTLYGHSYGGLFGTYVLLNQPELFNKYLILSPSLWFKERIMLNQVANLSPTFKAHKVYMASGALEGGIDDLQIQFAAKLKQRDFEGLDFKAEILDNETHRTIFGPGFTNGMRYLFE